MAELFTMAPGETLQDTLDERGMSQTYLAFATGYSQKHINQIIRGHVRITVEAALRLERELNISARFWLHLQADHDLALARGRRVEQRKREVEADYHRYVEDFPS